MTTTIGSGLGSSFGTAIETTYGTAPSAMTQWNAVDSAAIARKDTYFDGSGLRGGTLVQDSNDHLRIQADAAGTVKTNHYFLGMGRLLGSLFGSLNVAPSKNGATSSYTQTHAWQNPWNQSLTIQQGIPDVTGLIHWWQTVGVKITQGDFSCTNGQSLQSSFTVDGQDRWEMAGAGTTPVEPTGNPFFSWKDMTVKIGAFGAETSQDGISKWSATLKRSYADKRFNAGNFTTSGLTPTYAIKDQPVDNGFSQITGALDYEYLGDTLLAYFTTSSAFSLIVSFTSATLAAVGFPFSLNFAFPACYLIDGADPTVTGPDIVKPTLNYVVRYDETHPPCTVTAVSTDVTL